MITSTIEDKDNILNLVPMAVNLAIPEFNKLYKDHCYVLMASEHRASVLTSKQTLGRRVWPWSGAGEWCHT